MHIDAGSCNYTVLACRDSSQTERFRVRADGYLYNSGGSFYTPSDVKTKENISTIDNGLETCLKLRGVNFDWKEEYDPNLDRGEKSPRQTGFIAQEVKESGVVGVVNKGVFQEELLVISNNNQQITAYIIEAIKELSAKVTALENA